MATKHIKIKLQYLIDFNDLSKVTRKREILYPRYYLMSWIRSYYKNRMSLEKIGVMFGGKNHATVIHGIDMHNQMIKGEFKNKVYIEYCEYIKYQLDNIHSLVIKDIELPMDQDILNCITLDDLYRVQIKIRNNGYIE